MEPFSNRIPAFPIYGGYNPDSVNEQIQPLVTYPEPVDAVFADDKCYPWKPRTAVSESGNIELYLGLGTVNGLANASWDDPIVTERADLEEFNLYYILLEIKFQTNAINSIEYEVTRTLPDAEVLSPYEEDALPSSMKVIIGSIIGQDVCMIYDQNLLARVRLVFQEPQEVPPANGTLYKNFYTMDVVPITN